MKSIFKITSVVFALLFLAVTLNSIEAQAQYKQPSFEFYYTGSTQPKDYLTQGTPTTISDKSGWVGTAFNEKWNKGVNFRLEDTTSHDYWRVTMCNGNRDTYLKKGRYDFAKSSPLEKDEHRLTFSGCGRASSNYTGWFEVLDISYDSRGNLLNFAADFLMKVDNMNQWSYGSIRFNSPIPIDKREE